MTLSTEELRTAVRLGPDDVGRVSRKIYSDPELHAEELDTIFRATWQYVGHESQVRQSGDYITSYLGDDPVIVARTRDNEIKVHLNSCTHRGMRVCRADRGSTQFFRCTYHGWTFANDGRLVGVPKSKEGYLGRLDKSRLGLVAARVRVYHGLIFATWDQHGPSLEDYLGDLKWYLDAVLARNLGGWEVFQPVQRYRMPGNWKLASENFAGDTYHVLSTHMSSLKVGLYLEPGASWDSMGSYCVASRNGHGILDVPAPNDAYKADLAVAEQFGPEVVDYVHELRKVTEERCSPEQQALWRFGVFNMFPNFSMNDYTCLGTNGIFTWLPRGPLGIEVVQTAMFDSGAPDVIKQVARDMFLKGQSVAGFFGGDDTENFGQIMKSTLGAESRQHDFDYSMGIGHHVEGPAGWPGAFGPQFTEQNQRNFTSHWHQSMLAGRERRAATAASGQ